MSIEDSLYCKSEKKIIIEIFVTGRIDENKIFSTNTSYSVKTILWIMLGEKYVNSKF